MKMKTVNKILATTLGTVLTLASFGACGGTQGNIDPTIEDTENLYIYILKRGYGSDWLFKVAEKFEEKTGINVDVTAPSSATVLASSLDSGPRSTNDVDIYFNTKDCRLLKSNYVDRWTGYDNGIMDLTEVYNMKVMGEDITVGEKMVDSFRLNANTGTEENPDYRTIPWATGVMGMTYNIDVFKSLFGDTWESKLPRTTDELLALAKEIKGLGGTPFIFPGQIDYFSSSMFNVWFAQYSGYEKFKNFYNALVEDPAFPGEYNTSKDIFKDQGRLEAIEVMYSLINHEEGLYWENGFSYGSTDFSDLQVRYLTSENKVAMMPNGDWLENESAQAGSSEFGMMKSPVISSIIDRLPTVNDDATLAAVVDYVDGKTVTAPAGVSEADIKEIREARNMYFSQGLSHSAYMPAYSNAKTNAFKFFTYLASDEAIEIYNEYVGGGFLPFKYDYSNTENMSTFEKDISSLVNDMVYCGELNYSAMFYKGKLKGVYYSDGSFLETKLSAPHNNSVYMTPQEAFEEYWYTDAQWQAVVEATSLGNLI